MKSTLSFANGLAILIVLAIAPHATAAPAADAAADKPVVKILFHHNDENPYDIRLLSWCGGLASRVEVVPYTRRTLVIAYNTGDLRGAKITGAAPSRIGFRVCKNGKTTPLFDVLCQEKRETLLPGLVTRLSSIAEWKAALALQSRGKLDTKRFAHGAITGDTRDRYAYSPEPVEPADSPR